jgi:flagella basal body P-ring formation protein FlgA
MPSGAVTAPGQVAGRVLARGFMPGQALMLQALRSNPVVSLGDPVKVIVAGEGFTVASSGVALAQAEAGQAVRVRLESGRTLQGIAQQGRIVEVKL